jgi:phospholipid transport system substrate-binding protein
MPIFNHNNAIRSALLLMLAVVAPVAFAQDLAPDVLVKTIAQDIIALIKQDRDTYAANPSKLTDLVQSKVLPHFNFAHTTQIAMGAGWRRASPEQQGQIIGEFKTLLVHTYSNALMSYRNQIIDYKPLRAQPGDAEVTVRSQVKNSGGGDPIAIDYEMEHTASGWQIYDLKIGGVSLAVAYRDSFADEIHNHGIDGLINLLVSKNHQNSAKKAS